MIISDDHPAAPILAYLIACLTAPLGGMQAEAQEAWERAEAMSQGDRIGLNDLAVAVCTLFEVCGAVLRVDVKNEQPLRMGNYRHAITTYMRHSPPPEVHERGPLTLNGTRVEFDLLKYVERRARQNDNLSYWPEVPSDRLEADWLKMIELGVDGFTKATLASPRQTALLLGEALLNRQVARELKA